MTARRFFKVEEVERDLLNCETPYCIGATLKNGVIEGGFSEENTYTAGISEMVEAASLYEAGGIVGISSGGTVGLFLCEDATENMRLAQIPARHPIILPQIKNRGGEYRIDVIGNSRILSMVDGAQEMVNRTLSLSCGVIHCDRLFGADEDEGLKLKWSGTEGVKDWSESIDGAGSVILSPVGGYITGICSLGDYLYLIREGGITRFSANGSPENFKEMPPIYPMEGIEARSVRVIGRYIYFLKGNEVYRFNGGNYEKIPSPLSYDLGEYFSTSAVLNRYFAVCGTSIKLGRNALYLYDGLKDAWQIVDTPAQYAFSDDISMLVSTDTTLRRLVTGGNYAVELGDFAVNGFARKLLKRVEVDCEGDVKLEIYNGRNVRAVACKTGKIKLNMRGESFNFTFKGSGKVRSAKAVWEVRS